MGGELEFFAVDELNQPSAAVNSLVPKNNTFAFFKVGSKSFHQVLILRIKRLIISLFK